MAELEGAPAANMYGIVALTPIECREILTRQRLCILSTVDGNEPYAVPLFYGFDGETIYLGVAEGRKTRVLDSNSRVCLTVPDVGAGDSWRSVMIAGRAELVTDSVERERAVQVMIDHNRRPERQNSGTEEPGATSRTKSRHGGGRILRIADAEMTGRAKQ